MLISVPDCGHERQERVQDLGDADRLHRVPVVPDHRDGDGPGQRHLPALDVQLQGPRQGTLAVLVSGRCDEIFLQLVLLWLPWDTKTQDLLNFFARVTLLAELQF